MKVTISFESDQEDDGFTGETTISRSNVTDLYGLSRLFAEATVAGGFSYCKAVAIEKDDGTMVFGDL